MRATTLPLIADLRSFPTLVSPPWKHLVQLGDVVDAYDLTSGRKLATMKFRGRGDPVCVAAIGHDRIAAARGSSLFVGDLNAVSGAGQLTPVLLGKHANYVTKMRTNGDVLYSMARGEGAIRRWDLAALSGLDSIEVCRLESGASLRDFVVDVRDARVFAVESAAGGSPPAPVRHRLYAVDGSNTVVTDISTRWGSDSVLFLDAEGRLSWWRGDERFVRERDGAILSAEQLAVSDCDSEFDERGRVVVGAKETRSNHGSWQACVLDDGAMRVAWRSFSRDGELCREFDVQGPSVHVRMAAGPDAGVHHVTAEARQVRLVVSHPPRRGARTTVMNLLELQLG